MQMKSSKINTHKKLTYVYVHKHTRHHRRIPGACTEHTEPQDSNYSQHRVKQAEQTQQGDAVGMVQHTEKLSDQAILRRVNTHTCGCNGEKYNIL